MPPMSHFSHQVKIYHFWDKLKHQSSFVCNKLSHFGNIWYKIIHCICFYLRCISDAIDILIDITKRCNKEISFDGPWWGPCNVLCTQDLVLFWLPPPLSWSVHRVLSVRNFWTVFDPLPMAYILIAHLPVILAWCQIIPHFSAQHSRCMRHFDGVTMYEKIW